MIFSDKEFSQKLERTEARANIDFVETRARLDPEYGAEWIEVGGAYAVFDGVESPLTQTFCLGLFETATDDHLDELEAFFTKRDAPIFHEVSPMADASILVLLKERGYFPVELSSIMYRSLDQFSNDSVETSNDITTRIISAEEVDIWARTSADGWATEAEGLADFMFNFGRVGAQCVGGHPFLAELGGVPISTGSLLIYDDLCILAGASTIPEGRNRGAQSALLSARLKYAAEKGCTLAMMGAAPGSQSQRNAEKNGFRTAYTRTKWQLDVSVK
jgi:Acetyltransferase (GNAT) family.